MNARINPIAVIGFATLMALSTIHGQEAVKRTTSQRPQIEVCFALDTTASMSGLIEGAKAKIWSIANQMISAKPTPLLKIGMIGYRDRGDEYVTKVYDLNEDIDTVYSNLRSLSAGGGGDLPESVNQALFEAVNKMSWSPGNHLLKIVFLVGDCPPHMDYGDDATYSATCQSAMKKDVIINTIQCGTYPETAQVWQEVARLAEGTYVSIGQTGGMQVISTPMDKALADLNVEIGRTLVPYGSETRMREVKAKQAASESAAAPAAAERLAFNATTGKVVQGGGDLVDDLRSGSAKLEGLKDQDLPAQLRGQTTKEQHAYLDQQAAKRDELQAKITDLVKQRQAYLDAEMKKPAADGKDNSFDSKIAQIIQDQARRKGITYSTELQGLDRSEKK